jgi:hypothetical protein
MSMSLSTDSLVSLVEKLKALAAAEVDVKQIYHDGHYIWLRKVSPNIQGKVEDTYNVIGISNSSEDQKSGSAYR